ncbi:MAG: stringent starvation protein B [Brevundimonas sp.]|nr:MAG: stringent starvation protein B [Brevundimonas sp.]
MAEETPPVDDMHYEQLAQDALRGVIRSALERAAGPDGIPGAHHFYITFKTRAPGVSVPPDVIAKYPDEMTVVLQHQYWDLKVEQTKFSVMLKFGGMPKVLAMPYTAVTRFYDPSVQFMLQFEAPTTIEEIAAEVAAAETEATPTPALGGDDAPKVVSLDQFRKK